MKKAQITLFIIAGIAVLIVVGVFLYLQGEEEKPEQEIPVDIQPIKTYLDDCFEDVIHEGLYVIGFRGGYYEIPEPKIEESFMEIPVLNDKTPFDKIVVSEIHKFIDENIDVCTKNATEVFKEQGYTITYDDKKESKIILGKKDVLVYLNYPIKIEKEDVVNTLDEFYYEYNLPLLQMKSMADEFLKEHARKPDLFCYSCIHSLSEKYDFAVKHYFSGEYSVITIMDKKTTLGLNNYSYVFAVQHSPLESPGSEKVQLENISDMKAYVGEEFEYQAKEKNNKKCIFDDDADLFDIDPFNGTIKFTPTIDQKGEHIIKIKCTGTHNIARKMFILEIGDKE